MSMPFLTKSVNFAVGRVESGQQSRGAVAFVVVSHGLAATGLESQSGLGAIQGLDLAFLIPTEHQSVLGRVQIPSDNVFQLFGEFGIVADLEILHPMRLQSVTMPDAAHAGLTDSGRRGHRAGTPVRGMRRLVARGHMHYPPDERLGDRSSIPPLYLSRTSYKTRVRNSSSLAGWLLRPAARCFKPATLRCEEGEYLRNMQDARFCAPMTLLAGRKSAIVRRDAVAGRTALVGKVL